MIDPPWGGPQYSAAASIDDLPMGDISLALLLDLLRDHCDIVALRLPLNFNIDKLSHGLVHPSTASTRGESPGDEWVKLSIGDEAAERALPFCVDFDVSRFFVVCFPPRPDSRVRLGTWTLDAMIANMNTWNGGLGRQHHPRFYDWEKDRWIPLSRWRGCNAAAADDGHHSDSGAVGAESTAVEASPSEDEHGSDESDLVAA